MSYSQVTGISGMLFLTILCTCELPIISNIGTCELPIISLSHLRIGFLHLPIGFLHLPIVKINMSWCY